jgi:hypothetical protein
VTREELPAVERELPVISTKLLAGRTSVRVFAESSPGAEFVSVEPDLEDVYFSVMGGHLGRRAAVPAAVAVDSVAASAAAVAVAS